MAHKNWYTQYNFGYTTRVNYVIEIGRRQRKRQAMHQMLLDVAKRLFEEQGIARTTVDDIAEAADVARTTVFNHFPSKEAIALELASDVTQEIAQQAQALLDSGMPALDVLQCVARSFLDASLTKGDSAVAVARELLHPDPDRSARAQHLVPVRQIIEAILLQAREEDAVRDDLPLEVVAECFSALLVQIVTQVMTCEVPSLQVRLSVSLDILLNGITERRT
jgi:AcrR family transcriptional regulator